MAWDSQNRLLLINWSTKGGLVCLQEDNEKLLTLCDTAIFGSGPFLSTLALSHLNTTTCVSQLLLLSSCWQEAVGAIFITHFHTFSHFRYIISKTAWYHDCLNCLVHQRSQLCHRIFPFARIILQRSKSFIKFTSGFWYFWKCFIVIQYVLNTPAGARLRHPLLNCTKLTTHVQKLIISLFSLKGLLENGRRNWNKTNAVFNFK